MMEFLRADVNGDGVITMPDLQAIAAIHNKTLTNAVLPNGISFKSLYEN